MVAESGDRVKKKKTYLIIIGRYILICRYFYGSVFTELVTFGSIISHNCTFVNYIIDHFVLWDTVAVICGYLILMWLVLCAFKVKSSTIMIIGCDNTLGR